MVFRLDSPQQMDAALAHQIAGLPTGTLGTTSQIRELRRRLIEAQAVALEVVAGKEMAERFIAEALREVELVTYCQACGLELIGHEDCPRSHDGAWAQDYTTDDVLGD